MAAEKKIEKTNEKATCNDRRCPIHGDKKLKMRGRTFEGEVIKKLPGRSTINIDRILKLNKKIHFVVSKIIRKKEIKE